MYISVLFLCLVTPLSLISMDVEPVPLTDPAFLLWCGALTCKEINREEVTNITPRGFLGIDETNIPAGRFHVPHWLRDNSKLAPDEDVKIDPKTGTRDRRLGGRWRYLDDGGLGDLSQPRSDGKDMVSLAGPRRYHLSWYLIRSDNEDDSGMYTVKVHPNSIPYTGGYYLDAGVCAHKDGNIWIKADTSPMVLAETRERFPLRIMWIEPFKQPIILQEILLPGEKFAVVKKNAAVKFIKEDAQFQLFYDASELPVSSLRIHTYVLDRVKNLSARIENTVLARWYETYQHMKQDCLKEGELAGVAADMCAVVSSFETNHISG